MDSDYTPQPAAMRSTMDELQSSYADLMSSSQQSMDAHRVATVAKARNLIAALETPIESITWMAWAEPSRLAVTRVAIDLALFEHLSADGGVTKTHKELALKTGADPNLIGRILRHLASMRVIEEVAADTYKATPLSKALIIPEYRDAIPFCAEGVVPVLRKIPSFLARTDYKEPLDNTAGPFQYGHDTTLSHYMWRRERPHIQKAFNNHMAGYHKGRSSWMDPGFYPVRERIEQGMSRNDGDVAIVDVGGGMGQDLVELRKKQPSIPGRFVLQDQPQVIDQIPHPLEGIEATTHDFYTEQPVKGARVYFMHSVLHGYPDADCRRILQHILPAMKNGYSKMLIYENVVPDVGASWQITSLDWFMMSLAASRERTEAQWRELLGSAGLEVVGIWTKEAHFESLIEAQIPS